MESNAVKTSQNTEATTQQHSGYQSEQNSNHTETPWQPIRKLTVNTAMLWPEQNSNTMVTLYRLGVGHYCKSMATV